MSFLRNLCEWIHHCFFAKANHQSAHTTLSHNCCQDADNVVTESHKESREILCCQRIMCVTLFFFLFIVFSRNLVATVVEIQFSVKSLLEFSAGISVFFFFSLTAKANFLESHFRISLFSKWSIYSECKMQYLILYNQEREREKELMSPLSGLSSL